MSRSVRILVALLVAATAAGAAACGTQSPARPSEAPKGATLSVLPPVASSNGVSVEWRCVAMASDGGFYGVFSSAQVACPDGAGRPVSASGLRAAAVPSSPIALSSTVSGSTVVLSWSASAAASSYVVEAGSSPGLTDLANIDTGSSAPTLTATGVPAGTYYVRVRARNSEGVSGPSNETVVVVGGGGGCNAAPGAPTGLVATSSGSTVSLSWAAPGGGCPPQTYYIEAGSAPGLNDLADFSTGNPSTVFTAGGVGNGTYYVRVRAATPGGKSAPSNEATLVVGQAVCVGPPMSVSSSASGNSLSISWSDPATGVPFYYLVEIGTSPGAANIGVATAGVTPRIFTTTLPAGTYYIRMKTVAPCGTSAASNEVTATISGPTAPTPTPPTLRAEFTVKSTHPLLNDGQCAVLRGKDADSGNNVLTCRLDGSLSTGAITSYRWTMPAPINLDLTVSGSTVTDPRLGGCGQVADPGEVTKDLTLTVTSPGGSQSVTHTVTLTKSAPC
jgi:hypothetical protein